MGRNTEAVAGTIGEHTPGCKAGTGSSTRWAGSGLAFTQGPYTQHLTHSTPSAMQATKTDSDLIIPDVKAVAVDSTDMWTGELPELAGTIYDIYLYDKNWPVHACSFRAMHELFWVDVYTENRIEDDEKYFDLRHAAVETDVQYVPTTETARLEDATFPDSMFYDDRTKDFGSPPEDVWRDQVDHKGLDKAHEDHMRHSVQAYPENPLFA